MRMEASLSSLYVSASSIHNPTFSKSFSHRENMGRISEASQCPSVSCIRHVRMGLSHMLCGNSLSKKESKSNIRLVRRNGFFHHDRFNYTFFNLPFLLCSLSTSFAPLPIFYYPSSLSFCLFFSGTHCNSTWSCFQSLLFSIYFFARKHFFTAQ